jgi:hypothetical protein
MLTMPLSYTDVEPLPRVAFWPDHLFRGAVTMVVGPEGEGKGLIGVHATAVTVRGGLFPGESEQENRERTPGSVLVAQPEDDANEDVAPRLRGAVDGQGLTDAEQQHVYDITEDADRKRFNLNDQDSLDRARAIIYALACCDGKPGVFCSCQKCEEPGHEHPLHDRAQLPVQLMVLDPLYALCDKINVGPPMRAAMMNIMDLARETGIAVLIIHHLTGDGKQVAGSVEIRRTLRLIFEVGRSKQMPGGGDIVVRYLRKKKGNTTGKLDTLFYSITQNALGQPFLVWTNPDADPKPVAPARGAVPGWVTQRRNAELAAGRTLDLGAAAGRVARGARAGWRK